MAAALWWGSLTSVGFLVVPMLFARLGSPAIAGTMAGQFFSAMSWVSLACGLLLIIHVRSQADEVIGKRGQVTLALVATGLLLAMLQEYAVSPRILARENLKLWHSVGSAMYLLQWVCAACVLWRAGHRQTPG